VRSPPSQHNIACRRGRTQFVSFSTPSGIELRGGQIIFSSSDTGRRRPGYEAARHRASAGTRIRCSIAPPARSRIPVRARSTRPRDEMLTCFTRRVVFCPRTSIMPINPRSFGREQKVVSQRENHSHDLPAPGERGDAVIGRMTANLPCRRGACRPDCARDCVSSPGPGPRPRPEQKYASQYNSSSMCWLDAKIVYARRVDSGVLCRADHPFRRLQADPHQPRGLGIIGTSAGQECASNHRRCGAGASLPWRNVPPSGRVSFLRLA